MKKQVLFLVLFGSIAFKAHAVVFNFKGGATNKVDLILFKNKKKFEEFVEMAGGSKSIADSIEKFTKENSLALGTVIGTVAGTAATAGLVAASGGALTPAAALASNTVIIPAFVAVAQFSIENYGRIAQFGARMIKSFSTKLHVSHYLKNVTAPKTICLGLVGTQNRLIRSKEFFEDDKLMDSNDVRPMYLVIVNKERVLNENDREIIRNKLTGEIVSAEPRVYALPDEIIYAGPLSSEEIQSSIDIATYFIKKEGIDANGKPILEADGNPYIISRAVGVKLTPVIEFGGIECK